MNADDWQPHPTVEDVWTWTGPRAEYRLEVGRYRRAGMHGVVRHQLHAGGSWWRTASTRDLDSHDIDGLKAAGADIVNRSTWNA